MPTLTACPSCGGQLRVPDDLLGTTVRCPTCQTTFHAAPAPGPPAPGGPLAPPPTPTWKGRALEVDSGGPAAPPPAPRGLKGAVELKMPGDEAGPPAGGGPPPPPRRPAPPPREPEPPPGRRPDDRDADWRRGRDPDPDPHYDRPYYDRPYYDRPGPRDPYFRSREPRRLDTVPHRGSLILTLGVISLVCVVIPCIGWLIGIPMAIAAWILGHRDLRRIKNREIDEDGLSGTQGGWICGIIATVLNSLLLFTCIGMMVTGLLAGGNAATTTPKTPFAPTAAESK